MTTADFQEIIWQQGRELFREMPWRTDTNPYYVLVSELMLQQTQVDRVVPKFTAFVERFPTVGTLAKASLAEVLTLWSGLGYNRRAKFLHLAAQKIVDEFDGVIPSTTPELLSLPGVGVNTAGAIQAYSFNLPVLFIETNVRTVYFHHYFHDQQLVSDNELKEIIRETVDEEHPREWYWAIMDYGSWLKKRGYGALNKSSHYKKQAPLKGSLREVRGLILKYLAVRPYEMTELQTLLPKDDRFGIAVAALKKEGIIVQKANVLQLP